MKKLEDGIPIIGPLKIVLEPKIEMGFYISFEFETKLYKDIMNVTKKFDVDNDELIEVEESVNEDDDGDTKLRVKVSGEAEESMSVSVGFKENVLGIITLYFLAGIKGIFGRGEVGYSLEINFNKGIITTDRYYILYSFYFSFFLKLGMEIDLKFYKFGFEFYIFNVPLFGLKIEKHEVVVKTMIKLLFQLFVGSDKLNFINNNINYLM